MSQSANRGAPKRELNLFDSICIIVGIIIGAGIYETAPTVAGSVPSLPALMLVWLIGGVLSICGALCYAELASAYPEEGGDYVYLNRAFGGWAGYLFAWGQLIIIRPGSIAAILFPFGRYAQTFWNPLAGTALETRAPLFFAVAAVLILTAVNMVGVRQGKLTQNLLSVLKVLGLILIIATAVIGFVSGTTDSAAALPAPAGWNLNLAMILILFTYGGWNEIAYVAAEVESPQRNILRSLVAGVLAVSVIYLLVNCAFYSLLGHGTMASSQAVAVDSMAVVWSGAAARFIALLVCVSTLGAANGMIFTGARISYAFGCDQPGFGWLSGWSEKYGTPCQSLLLQGALSATIVVLAGSFSQSVIYTTTVVWFFFLLTGLSVFVLRAREPQIDRPYRIHGHPFTTIIFCLSCVFLMYSAAVYDLQGTAIAVGLLLTGLLFRRSSGQSH
jgi:amino acid transporter